MLLRPHQPNRATGRSPIRTLARIVMSESLCEIVRDADVEGMVRALEDVAEMHSKTGATRLRPLGSARDTISSPEMVEAGGVEPPSEKPCHSKTTCLACSGCGPAEAVRAFADVAQNRQDAKPASPIGLAAALRTETQRPAYCVTPHPKRAGDAWGDALPTFG